MKNAYLLYSIFFILVLGLATRGLIQHQIAYAKQKRLTNLQAVYIPPTDVPTPTLVVPHEISLSITSPKDQSKVQTSSLSIIGTTQPKAEVYINDISTIADSKGYFNENVKLDEGENTFTIMANDGQGKYAEKQLTVTFLPPDQQNETF